MPAVTQRFFIEPSFHFVTLRVVRFVIEIIDSMQFVVASVIIGLIIISQNGQ